MTYSTCKGHHDTYEDQGQHLSCLRRYSSVAGFKVFSRLFRLAVVFAAFFSRSFFVDILVNIKHHRSSLAPWVLFLSRLVLLSSTGYSFDMAASRLCALLLSSGAALCRGSSLTSAHVPICGGLRWQHRPRSLDLRWQHLYFSLASAVTCAGSTVIRHHLLAFGVVLRQQWPSLVCGRRPRGIVSLSLVSAVTCIGRAASLSSLELRAISASSFSWFPALAWPSPLVFPLFSRPALPYVARAAGSNASPFSHLLPSSSALRPALLRPSFCRHHTLLSCDIIAIKATSYRLSLSYSVAALRRTSRGQHRWA